MAPTTAAAAGFTQHWDQEALQKLTRKELQKVAKQNGIRANNKTEQIISDLLTALGGTSHHHTNPLAEGADDDCPGMSIALRRQNPEHIGTFMSFPQGLEDCTKTRTQNRAAAESGDNPIQSITVHATRARFKEGDPQELEADAETALRALEKSPSHSPSTKSGGSGSKRGMSPVGKFKSLMASMKSGKAGEDGTAGSHHLSGSETSGNGSPSARAGACQSSMPFASFAASQRPLRLPFLLSPTSLPRAAPASWASPQAHAKTRTDEWLEVLKPSPALSGDSPHPKSAAKPHVESEVTSRASLRNGAPTPADMSAKKRRAAQPMGVVGAEELSPRMPPGGFCGIGVRGRGRGSGRAALAVKPRSVLRPLTPRSASKANAESGIRAFLDDEKQGRVSLEERKLMRSKSVANIEELGAELQRMQAELRKSGSARSNSRVPRRGRMAGSPGGRAAEVEGTLQVPEAKRRTCSDGKRESPAKSAQPGKLWTAGRAAAGARTPQGAVGPRGRGQGGTLAPYTELLAKPSARTLKRASYKPGTPPAPLGAPPAAPRAPLQERAVATPRPAATPRGTLGSSPATPKPKASKPPQREPAGSRAKPLARAPAARLPSQAATKPSATTASTPSRAGPFSSLRAVYGSNTQTDKRPYPAASTGRKASKKATPTPSKMRGAPRCAYVSTSAASGQTPVKQGTAAAPPASRAATATSHGQQLPSKPTGPRQQPAHPRKPSQREDAPLAPVGRLERRSQLPPAGTDSPRTPKFDSGFMADALQIAEAMDPTPARERPHTQGPAATNPTPHPSARDCMVQHLLRSSVVRPVGRGWEDVPELTRSLRSCFMASFVSSAKAQLSSPPFGLLLVHDEVERVVEPLASETNATFLHISAEALGSKDGAPNGVQREVQDAAFTEAMSAPRAVVLVSYLNQQPKGKAARDVRMQLMSDLCLYLDACASSPERTVSVLVASNRPETLSSELMEYLVHRFLLPLPQAAAREEILLRHLVGHSDDMALGVDDFEELARATEGFTTTELVQLCQSILARNMAAAGAPHGPAKLSDFRAALEQCTRSVPDGKVARLESWAIKNSAMICADAASEK
eukprot:CAMPEP_0117696216 /NCGR_PEP_ID=MMETSP0804-20121206/28558_1 /TAXON_ID=1074897 /ORGANISM="Tetraselmis astigmatica, Strain CCMP880" /LENGTH=1088 /DNA_ID=CAMNT_0005510347 /DNA_START=99 /DNA_END=3367 /DNA_ORIENTATION=-